LGAKPEQVLYPIDAGARGTQIVNSFALFTPSGGTNLPYYVLQTGMPNNTYYTTTRFISNGIIPYVQSITKTTYNTLLIIGYLPPPSSGQQSILQYVVVPSDEIVALNYFPQNFGPIPNIATPFTSSAIPGTIPFFSVDPAQRASDIASAVNTLMTTLKNSGTNSQVYVQTSLNGPFNPPLPKPGLLQNITKVAYNNTLVQFTFLTSAQQPAQTVLVAPEQVQQIFYIRQYGVP
jgi:hypothetical protein